MAGTPSTRQARRGSGRCFRQQWPRVLACIGNGGHRAHGRPAVPFTNGIGSISSNVFKTMLQSFVFSSQLYRMFAGSKYRFGLSCDSFGLSCDKFGLSCVTCTDRLRGSKLRLSGPTLTIKHFRIDDTLAVSASSSVHTRNLPSGLDSCSAKGLFASPVLFPRSVTSSKLRFCVFS
jgi:hypothetical protein